MTDKFAHQELLDRGVSITERAVRNIVSARGTWALWEAFNDRLVEGGALSAALEWHGPPGLAEIRVALAETTVLAILRSSENPQNNDSSSLCLLRGLLANDDVVAALSSEAWISHDKQMLPTILHFERSEQPKRIQWFNDRVPLGWGRGYSGADVADLARTRNSLRQIRDKVIAHSSGSGFDAPSIDQVRDALTVTCEIGQRASLIFLGHTSGLDTELFERVRAYDDFWHFFERGLTSAHDEWRSSQRTLSG